MTPKPVEKQLILEGNEPSLLFAINELLRREGINFDKWWDEFKKPPKNKIDLQNWTKPKYIDITPKDSEVGRWIRYYPDTSDETTFYTLSGNDSDLVHHINAIAYSGGSAAGGIPGKNSKPPLEGFPLIELYFISPDKKTGVKRLRLTGYTDNDKIVQTGLVKLLTSADVSRVANKIKSVFGDTKYVWKKGKNVLSYSGMIPRLQGLEGWALCQNKTDGINLFTAILKIIDAVPDKDGFNFSGSTSTTKYKAVNREQPF